MRRSSACFHALKPGGILGVEDHRGRSDQARRIRRRRAATCARTTRWRWRRRRASNWSLKSEINANPKDTKDWVDGVWTLPPTLSQGDKDRAKYQAIGEADNFVLKFRKPAH